MINGEGADGMGEIGNEKEAGLGERARGKIPNLDKKEERKRERTHNYHHSLMDTQLKGKEQSRIESFLPREAQLDLHLVGSSAWIWPVLIVIVPKKEGASCNFTSMNICDCHHGYWKPRNWRLTCFGSLDLVSRLLTKYTPHTTH